jgi:radical SAM superfamily enzyme YgiQ (UPF0313 family)
MSAKHIAIILPTSYDDHGTLFKQKKATWPNLTILYLAAMVPNEYHVTIVEEAVEDINFDASVDLVALSVLTGNSRRAYDIASEYRRRGVPVVMGGIHPTCMPDEAAQHADSIVMGEAEDTWPSLIEDFHRGTMKKVYQEVKRESLANLPYPRFDLIKPNQYRHISLNGSIIIPIQTSRGCPFNCDFCSVTRFWGRTLRYRPIEDVVQEIRMSRGKTICFTDDNFLSNPERSIKLCEAIKPLKIKWFCQMDVNSYRREEVIKAMAESGCFMAFLGFESVDPNTLKRVGKGFNKPEDYAEVFRIFSKFGISIYASFIFGFGADNPGVVKSTVDFLVANRARMAAFFPLSPNPGTDLYSRMKEAGKLTSEQWWLSNNPERIKYAPGEYSGLELARMAYQYFYSYPSILKRFFSPKKNDLIPLILNLAFRHKIKKSPDLKAIL